MFKHNLDLFRLFNVGFSPMSLPGLEGFRRDLRGFCEDRKALHFGLCRVGLVD